MTHKKKFIIILFSFLFLNNSFSQKSEIAVDSVTKLKSLSKVWGFLKYYHPKVSIGKFDWDKELVEMIPSVLGAESSEDLNKKYQLWFDNLGKVKNKKSKNENRKYFDKNFDLSWIDNNSIFNNETSLKLRNIEKNRNLGNKHYVNQSRSIGNVIIKNEKEYSDIEFPELEYRILNLFRYWNIIEYFSPNKYLISKDWDKILEEMIPRFIKVSNKKDYHLLILELVALTEDGHSRYITKETNDFFGFFWAPFKYKVVENKVIITGYYNKEYTNSLGLKIGDVITQIDGINIFNKLNDRIKYTCGSNIYFKKNSIYLGLFNDSKKEANITFLRKGKLHKTVLKRYKFKELNYKPIKKPKWKVLDGNIGYANLSQVKTDNIENLMDELSNCKGIILDLRYGVKNLWGGLGKYLKRKRGPFIKILRADLSYPGKFYFGETKNCCYEMPERDLYKGRIILLVNENTISHGEFTSMAYQSGDNVTTIGSQTAGADGDISYIPFIDGNTSVMTGVGVFYPDGEETQKRGIRIDIKVMPTIEGILKQKDEVLEKAINIINE